MMNTIHYYLFMPTLRRFGKIRIVFWPNDHIPPHCHFISPGYTARFCLESLKIVEDLGQRPSGLAEVEEWAKRNMTLLHTFWNKTRQEG